MEAVCDPQMVIVMEVDLMETIAATDLAMEMVRYI
jgi:hypothetical protein